MYCQHNFKGRPILNKITNRLEKYKLYINNLKLKIESIYDVDQNRIETSIKQKIEITRDLNKKLIDIIIKLII